MSDKPTPREIDEIKALWAEYFAADRLARETPCMSDGKVSRDWIRADNVRVEILDNLSERACLDTPKLLAHIDALEAEIGALREAILNLGGDPDQAWFWTDRWQQLEREAQEDIDAGRVEDASDFLAE